MSEQPVTSTEPALDDVEGASTLRRSAQTVLRTVGRRVWHLDVENPARVPHHGGAIVAANHISFFDSVALMMAMPRCVAFVGKSEYLSSWKTRRLFPAFGMIPIDRASGFRSWDALENAARVLRGGGVFAIYPEGTRSRDGRLHRGRSGVGQLAVVTGAPIIPVGIVGTDAIQPPGARVPRPFRRAVVRFGRPIVATDYHGSRRERRRRITADVMAAIRDLSGQEYTEEDGVSGSPSACDACAAGAPGTGHP